MNRKWFFFSTFILIVAFISIPLFLVVNGTVAVSVGPSTRIITEQKFSKNFEKIRINIEADIIIGQKDQDSVKIEASGNQTPRIKISQTSKTISIDNQNTPALDIKLLTEETRPKIFVYIKEATEIEINTKSKVEIQKYKIPSLKILFNSNGSLIADSIETENLEITQTLAGFVSIKGTSDNLSLYSSNSSRTLLRFMPVKKASINSQGSGAIELNVTETLDVKIAGSSPIRYQGVPTITKEITGDGSLTSF